MATFVLVHGAWHGAWCWRRLARLLTRNGHDVFAPTLTGLAERSHLLTPDIDLDTHILDVVNEMKWQELSGVVLVGHSYGGMVISGVAEKMEKAIVVCAARCVFPESSGKLLSIWPRRRCVTAYWPHSAMAQRPSRRGRRRCSMSMRRTALGWMRDARRSRSNACCRS